MAKAKTAVAVTGDQARTERLKRRMNQSDFWTKLGITQSGASRYESGRNIPKPTQKLLRIAYLSTEAQAAKLVAELRGQAS